MTYKIHPTAIVDDGALIGDGSHIWHWVHISGGARIGKRCSFGQNVYIGNDVVIGDNVKVQNNVSIYDSVTLEDYVFCGPSMVFTNVYNPRSAVTRKTEYRHTLVKKGATLGANCTIVCGVTVGEYAFVAAGAVVNRNIKPYALMAGVAAQADRLDERARRAVGATFDWSCGDNLSCDRFTVQTRSWKLYMSRPMIPFIDLKTQYQALKPKIQARIDRVLEHGQYIMGPEVKELEDVLAAYVGARHCISVSSGTDTLLVGMMALGIARGDEVITTPFTFIATGEMIALLGAKPVFVDIDSRTGNIDPNKVEAAITSRTKAIIPVSLYGQCADMDAINAIAEKRGLPVIEDAAQSFGATYKGRKSCALSTIGSTSFFPSKPLGGYGDGGALFTNDDVLAKAMREIRVHGQDRRYHHPRIGINGRLDTIQAAILLAKLERFDWEVEQRQKVGAGYTALLSKHCPFVCTPEIDSNNTSVYAQYTIQVDDRDAISRRLNDAGIPTAIHYPMPLHLQPAFQNYGYLVGDFPVAENLASRVLSLPMGPDLASSDQSRIVEALTGAQLI